MGTQLIYDSSDLTTYAEDMLSRIDDAVVAAAYKIRDNIRQTFINGSNIYKHRTNKINDLAQGINVGKLQDSKVKIHAMGTKDNYHTYKTRFFVGGTVPRTQTKWRGKPLQKPYTKGYIKSLDSIDKGMSGAEGILNTYIQNVLDN